MILDLTSNPLPVDRYNMSKSFASASKGAMW
jgi:hypothetical protein